MGYCSACQSDTRRLHLSTAKHRRATRPRVSGRRSIKPRAMRRLYEEQYRVSDAEERAAAHRLGIEW